MPTSYWNMMARARTASARTSSPKRSGDDAGRGKLDSPTTDVPAHALPARTYRLSYRSDDKPPENCSRMEARGAPMRGGESCASLSSTATHNSSHPRDHSDAVLQPPRCRQFHTPARPIPPSPSTVSPRTRLDNPHRHDTAVPPRERQRLLASTPEEARTDASRSSRESLQPFKCTRRGTRDSTNPRYSGTQPAPRTTLYSTQDSRRRASPSGGCPCPCH